MALYGLGRNFYQYTSDDTTVYQVAITNDDAVAGNFGAAITPGSFPGFPRGWRMRRVYGINGTTRTSVPVSDPTQALYVSGGSFTKNSVVFNSQGIRGEQRYTRS